MRKIISAALILVILTCILGATIVSADQNSLMGTREQLKSEKEVLAQERTFIKTSSGATSTSYIVKTDAGNLTVSDYKDNAGNRLLEYRDSNGNLVKSIVMLGNNNEILTTIYDPNTQQIQSESYANTRNNDGLEVTYNTDGSSQEVLHNLGTGESLTLNVDKQGNITSPPIYKPTGGGTTFCSNNGKFEQNEPTPP